MAYEEYYQARETILDFIRRDAVGPVEADEILDEPPLETYVCGVLWPKKKTNQTAQVGGDADSVMEDGDPEDENAEAILETGRYRRSVMAMSFALPGRVAEVKARFRAAWYDHSETTEYPKHHYARRVLDTGEITVKLSPGFCLTLLDGKAVLRVSFRREYQDGSRLWTISLENSQPHSRNEYENNTHALFQCELRVFGEFLPVDRLLNAIGSADRKVQNLLYRHVHQYAAGHGCSVQWDDGTPVEEIRSDFLPCASVPQMIASVPENGNFCFLMDAWRDETKQEAIQGLRDYIAAYGSWARQLKDVADQLGAPYRETAEKALSRVKLCAERLSNGLDVLENNPTAWRAFVYANEAMKRQSAKKRNQPENVVSWYPFQLCYVVMCLPDLVDPSGEWHDTVDLLWFPTGGGKTEAYLGVAAFAIFYRRLSQKAGGVAVLMRYTLRMLTAQQFERAAALICECELIRRSERLPGGEISIGMWVGSGVTPNHVTSDSDYAESAKAVLEKLREGETESVTSNPIQLHACPYCGTPLDAQNAYQVVRNEFRAHCPSADCPFHDELPIVTVDDDIYKRRPTLLISTVDKFARLTWEKQSGALFATDGNGLPPSLLIQDELHLISGPLGSVSGLYEITIENLCERQGVGPKIIAATATVRNASGQIRALYGREHFQFPPSGLDVRNSFFARQARPDERPERLYVGYCETGGSLVDAIVRTFASVSFALRYLSATGTPDNVVDQFWTNVGYFNSLKDLGSADTLILDRVCAYAESLRQHKFRKEANRVGMTEKFQVGEYEHGELTSRKNPREITDIRTILDTVHYPADGAYSYVLSSNMLSVGIDIGRLGLMTVYGQPKSTAEYIQATSRVGRSNPGLVITLLHMMRARDKGHFERFKAYHQTLNRMVEPTSAAPYASRTLEKALHAVFVILVRHRIPDLREEGDAGKFRAGRADVMAIRDEILERIRRQSPDTADYAEELLDSFMDYWEQKAKTQRAKFRYQDPSRSADVEDVLLVSAEQAESADFPVMNSMRNVDTQSNVHLMKRK